MCSELQSLAGQGQPYPVTEGCQERAFQRVGARAGIGDGDFGVPCAHLPTREDLTVSSGRNPHWHLHKWFLAVPARANTEFFLK